MRGAGRDELSARKRKKRKQGREEVINDGGNGERRRGMVATGITNRHLGRRGGEPGQRAGVCKGVRSQPRYRCMQPAADGGNKKQDK